MSRHLVLGTAGHIDHGKTSLVGALTGTNTDRLPEEQRRGITIELGFAQWRLSDDTTMSVVDVPGHEKLVRNMVAGAGGIDAVLLVVAADDGVMPQTREHLAICELLGIEKGIVAVTKIDTVDDELRELVVEDIRDTLTGSVFENSPVIGVSSVTNEGIETLTAAVKTLVAELPDRQHQGPAFLPIDRVFSRSGHGTVVTGTLFRGQLTVGDELWLHPPDAQGNQRRVQVRGLQVHGETQGSAPAGRRVAVNIRGADADSVERGDVLVSAGFLHPQKSILVWAKLLDGAPEQKERTQVSVHLGSRDVLCRMVPATPLIPGDLSGALVRLDSDEPIVAFTSQRFVMRQPGKHGFGTIGGGRVVDPAPVKVKGALKRWAQHKDTWTSPDPAAHLLTLLEDARATGIARDALTNRVSPDVAIDDLIASLSDRVASFSAGSQSRIVKRQFLDDTASVISNLVAEHHERRPFSRGVSPSELKSRLLPNQRELAAPAIDQLIQTGALEMTDGVMHDAKRQIPTEVESAMQTISQHIEAEGLTPQGDDKTRQDLKFEVEAFSDALSELKRRGTLTLVQTGLHFSSSAMSGLVDKVNQFFSSGNDELSTSDFKELSGGVSRKYAIPLLEWLDTQGVTRRQGDVRIKGR